MDALVSVGEVADRFDLAISTLHYWERRGLLTPRRRSGRRYYDPEQLYRIALIRLWRDTGRMSLDEIAAVLTGRTAGRDWHDTVETRLAAVEAQIADLGAARHYLSHLLRCPCDNPFTECATFRREVVVPGKH